MTGVKPNHQQSTVLPYADVTQRLHGAETTQLVRGNCAGMWSRTFVDNYVDANKGLHYASHVLQCDLTISGTMLRPTRTYVNSSDLPS